MDDTAKNHGQDLVQIVFLLFQCRRWKISPNNTGLTGNLLLKSSVIV